MTARENFIRIRSINKSTCCQCFLSYTSIFSIIITGFIIRLIESVDELWTWKSVLSHNGAICYRTRGIVAGTFLVLLACFLPRSLVEEKGHARLITCPRLPLSLSRSLLGFESNVNVQIHGHVRAFTTNKKYLKW